MSGAAVLAGFQKAKAINQNKPSNKIISSAQNQLRTKYGITAYIRPRMLYLSLLKLVLSKPFLMLMIGIATGTLIFGIFFGMINFYYCLYYFKGVIAVIVNVFLTIGNATIFAFNAFTQILTVGFNDVINSIIDFVLTPFANAINRLAVWTTLSEPGSFFIDLPAIGDGSNFSVQPTHGFSYIVPSSAVSSAFGFIFVHPGAEIYETDSQGNIIYDLDFTMNGAGLAFPRMNAEAEASGIWSEIRDRPPDLEYSFQNSLIVYTSTFYNTIYDWATGWISNAINSIPQAISQIPEVVTETIIEQTPPPSPIVNVPLLWDIGIWISGIFGGK